MSKDSPIRTTESFCWPARCPHFRTTSIEHVCDFYKVYFGPITGCQARLKRCKYTDDIWMKMFDSTKKA